MARAINALCFSPPDKCSKFCKVLSTKPTCLIAQSIFCLSLDCSRVNKPLCGSKPKATMSYTVKLKWVGVSCKTTAISCAY